MRYWKTGNLRHHEKNRVIGMLLFGLAIILSVGWGGTSECLAKEAELAMQEVSYTTEDNITIYGSWIVPEALEDTSSKLPVVILLHDYGFDRRDWGVFIPDLIEKGFCVFVIDIRGHGKSTSSGQRFSGQYSPSVASYLLEMGYLDVLGALDWINEQKEVRPKSISLVGVGLGADLAYLSAKKFKKRLRASVIISPSLAAVTEGDFADPKAQAVLFCVTTGDATGSSLMAAESMANFTEQPKRLVTYQSTAHGLAMFYKHPEMKREILAWLGQ